MNKPATVDRNIYGARESNGLVDGLSYHASRQENHGGMVAWTTKGLKVTRLRLLSDPGFPAYDVSYCHGILDGKHVDVELPFSQLNKRNLTGQIIEFAKKDKVFAKGLGILDAISILN